MWPLAFDKQGKAFSFQRRTKKLLVRLFRNPSARGTCCQVLGTDGQALYIDPETDYVEFRRAVGQVPGLYRLDQCDEDGNELDDAQPAYVSIDVARNAQSADSGTSHVNPLVIIRQMAAIQADVMKTMAAQQAALLAATAEILRAPYRPAAAVPAADLRNAAATTNEDEADELEGEVEEEEEAQPESTLVSVARMVDSTMPNMAAQLGEFLYEKFFELMKKKEKAPIAVAAVAAAAAPAPSPVQSATVSAATVSAAPRAHNVVTHVEVTPPPAAVTTDARLDAVAPNAPDVASAMPPVPMAHRVAIRERLDMNERAVAEAATQGMTSEQLAHWLAELSEQSVDDATATIRDLIAQIRKATQRPSQP